LSKAIKIVGQNKCKEKLHRLMERALDHKRKNQLLGIYLFSVKGTGKHLSLGLSMAQMMKSEALWCNLMVTEGY
jgi:hypothetical protein